MGPGRRSALFAAGLAAMVVAVLGLGSLPTATRVERAAATGTTGPPSPERREDPVPPPSRAAPRSGVAAGGHAVGPGGVRPGVHVATGDLCSWERRGPGGVVLAADAGSGQVLVEVLPTDERFVSSPGCGRWRPLDAGRAAPRASFGSGTVAVGSQVAPGRWRSDGAGLCYWERLSGLTGGLHEVVASATVDGPAEVELLPGDVGFGSLGCGTWHRVG